MTIEKLNKILEALRIKEKEPTAQDILNFIDGDLCFKEFNITMGDKVQ